MQKKQSVNYQERGKAANRLLSTTQGATKRVPYVYRDVRMCASVFWGGYADCSACNPPWYLNYNKKGCTPYPYLTDILYLTIS